MTKKKKGKSLGDEFGTPQGLYNVCNEEFHFTLDAAASDKNFKCDNYFTKVDNSLLQPWFDPKLRRPQRVWCNPPYSRRTETNPGLEAWCRKAYAECIRANRYESVKEHNFFVEMLIPGDFSTRYFKFCETFGHEIRLIGCRFNFEGGESSARFPGALIIFSSEVAAERGAGTLIKPAPIKLWDGWRPSRSRKL